MCIAPIVYGIGGIVSIDDLCVVRSSHIGARLPQRAHAVVHALASGSEIETVWNGVLSKQAPERAVD